MKVERLSSNRVRYDFEVTSPEFEHGLDHAFEHVIKDVEIKGFRKGKVPRNIYEQKFGVESLYEDAINHVLHHKYHEVIEDPNYEIVGEPKIDIDVAAIERGKPFNVSFEVPVKPEVTLGQYKGVEGKSTKVEVTPEEVEKQVKALLSKDGNLVLKENGVIEQGDTAIFDFEGFLNDEAFEGGKAENYELVIGSNQFIPGFEEQMIGMKSGEEKDIKVTFPENYQAENLAGQEVVFKIKLHEVKIKTADELTDEWVKSLERENVQTVEELKQDLLKELENEKEQASKNDFANEVISKIIDSTSLDIPQEMIDTEKNNYIENVKRQAKQYNMEYDMFLSIQGMDKEAFEKQAEQEAFKRVRSTLVFEAIAKAENITPSEEALEAKYEDISKQYNIPIEDVKKHLPRSVLENEMSATLAYDFVLKEAVKV
jgi:trigger factor